MWNYFDYIEYGYNVLCLAITLVIFICILHPTGLLILDCLEDKNENNNNKCK